MEINYLMRSLMFVPAHNQKLLDSSLRRDADVLLLDIEDSVPVVDKQQARDRKERRVPEGVHEGGILQRGQVVAKADQLCVADQLEFTEGQINALEEGPYKADGKSRRDRSEKQPEPAAEGIFENAFQTISSLFSTRSGFHTDTR